MSAITVFLIGEPEPINTANSARPSITFILGKDGGANSYYKQATYFYKYNDVYSSDYVIEDVDTYLGILSYLRNNSCDKPWGDINLVVHANPWTGMQIKIDTNGERVDSDVLLAMIMADKLRPLPLDIVDSYTVVNVHGCALGLNTEIKDLIAISFGGIEKINRPNVRISEKFISYYSSYFDEIYSSDRYEASPYFTFYRKGYKWGDIRLARKLRKGYPDANVDWRDALKRKEPRWKGDSYYMTFNIPIDWT